MALRGSFRSDASERAALCELRTLAEYAFSRAGGAPLIAGNQVLLLKDASENYPAWLKAIAHAKDHVHFECYIIHEDEAGRQFSEALIAKAREGVRVRLIYDWLGGFGKASRRFWQRLRAGGVEVRCYNPPRLDSPLGWVSRDHRKVLAVDGQVGFVTGLCVGSMWVGDPARNQIPWRDTGVQVRGQAVVEIERAFARIWATLGEPLPKEELPEKAAPAGDMMVRIVASEPATAGMLRLDLLVSSLARKRLWLTDAYYAGTTSYVQALRAAARDGVDVRLLLPGGSDIPILRPVSRAGYRPLLEAGVRIFEWNGSMLHAKTAVADGYWARVGSTNLNIASWFGNCELDAVIADESFAAQMEQMYLDDLGNATEIVLDEKHKVRAPGAPRRKRPVLKGGQGSAGRAAAGAVRIGSAIGAAITDRRALGPIEARLTALSGLVLCSLAVLFLRFPGALVYPVVVFSIWGGLALLYRGYRLHRGQNGRVGKEPSWLP